MGKNTSFVKHMPCEECGSSDANALYSDGSTYCFSCRVSKQPDADMVQQVQFKQVENLVTLDEISDLPVDTIRGISKEVVYDSGTKVEYDENRNIICHYYPITVNGKVKAYKKRLVNSKEFRVVGKVEVPELFNQSKVGRRKNLVITEGEIDCLSILQMLKKEKYQMDVVSIVNGAQSARRNIASNLDFVNSYTKVFIAFDNDEQGIQAAKEVAHIIKPGKAHIVNFAEAKDANEAMSNELTKEYMQAIWNAKGYQPDSFLSGEKIWNAFVERAKVQSIPYPDCLKGLNDKLLGMRQGEIVLFTSGTGSGKSTVVKEVILNLIDKTEDKIGIVSLEEAPGETATKLIGMAINKNIKVYDDSLKDESRKAFEKFQDRIILLDHQGAVQDQSLLQRIEYLAAYGCKYIILDHITIAVSEGAEGKTGNEAIDKVMSEFLKIVKRYDINLTLISHLRKVSGEHKSFEEGVMPNLDAIKGSGSIKQISFDIIAFARNLMAVEKHERNTIKLAVLKSRFTGDTGFCGQAAYNPDSGRLSFMESTIAFKES